MCVYTYFTICTKMGNSSPADASDADSYHPYSHHPPFTSPPIYITPIHITPLTSPPFTLILQTSAAHFSFHFCAGRGSGCCPHFPLVCHRWVSKTQLPAVRAVTRDHCVSQRGPIPRRKNDTWHRGCQTALSLVRRQTGELKGRWCMCTHMCMCVDAGFCMSFYTCIYLPMFVYVYVCLMCDWCVFDVYMYVYVCVYLYVLCVCLCVCSYLFICICVCVSEHVHICICICMYLT